MRENCTTKTTSHWMPLSGVYIAMATLACVIAIVVDLVEGLRNRQYWIPSNFSSLNAVSLFLIGAASKLSLDLSTPMPRQIDQLSKLSTSTFVCIALTNVAPSIGKLKKSELLANITALAGFVTTSAVGLCIQLRKNGVIFAFKPAHITMIFVMSVLLVHFVVSPTSTALFKSYFKVRYNTQHRLALSALHDDNDIRIRKRKHPTTKKLKEYLERFCMMAHSGCPQFLMGRSMPGTIHTVCGLVAAIAFFTILIACKTHRCNFVDPCPTSIIECPSKYDWSVEYIFIIQTIGVGVGTIVICIRGFYNLVVSLGKPDDKASTSRSHQHYHENFWMQHSEYLKRLPFLPGIEYRQQNWLGYLFKYPFYVTLTIFLLILRTVDMILCWIIPHLFWECIISIIPVCPQNYEDCKELRPYFLQQDDKYYKIGMLMRSILYVNKRCLAAKERETKNLVALLRDYHSDDGFEEVFRFRIPPPPNSKDNPPNCWALSVLTLTCIATALPHVDRDAVVKLRKSVKEGLVYVKLIEIKCKERDELATYRTAAFILWGLLVLMDMVSFCLRLTPLALKELVLRNTTAEGTLKLIECCAGWLFTAIRSKTAVYELIPYVAHAAHYVYGTCRMILSQDYSLNEDDPGGIFEELRIKISDILGACLTNLKSHILQECEHSSSIEKRREASCQILKLFGETEEIMEILETRKIPEEIMEILDTEKMFHMENWYRSYHHHHPADELS